MSLTAQLTSPTSVVTSGRPLEKFLHTFVFYIFVLTNNIRSKIYSLMVPGQYAACPLPIPSMWRKQVHCVPGWALTAQWRLPSLLLKGPKPALKPNPKASPLDFFLAAPLQRYFPPSFP